MLRWARQFGLTVPLELKTFRARVAERSTVRAVLAEEGLDEASDLQRAV